jgi:hypothetical protein
VGAAASAAGSAAAAAGSAAKSVVAAAAPSKSAAPPRTAKAATQGFLANDAVRIGVDLTKGGAITFFGPRSGGENLVNTHDLGREIQPSYYAGPTPFGQPLPPYQNMPWNPILAGDITGNASRVLAYSNDGHTLYVKSLPQQWALQGVACECMIEQWVTLEGRAAWVRDRLTNFRGDATQYPALPQELPAIYAIGKLDRLVTYGGTNPYANDAVSTFPRFSDGLHFVGTEHWAALVDRFGRGFGVFQPGVSEFYASTFGKTGAGSSSDFATSYLAPTTTDVLDHNVVYDFSYALVLGTASDVRTFALQHRGLEDGPAFTFTSGREHWTYVNATDAGWPVSKALRVNLDQNDPQLIGPQELWPAGVSTVYVRAAYHGAVYGDGELFWHGPGDSFSADKHAVFPIVADGAFHTYAVALGPAAAASRITQLRLDPATGNDPGAYVELQYVSPQPISALDAAP